MDRLKIAGLRRLHDGAQRRQGFVDRLPDAAFEDVFVIVAVDAAGTRNCLPGDFV